MENKKTILVTGSAGFIGYSASAKLLNDGFNVIGIDSISDYYDVNLKKQRHNLLKQNNNFSCYEISYATHF